MADSSEKLFAKLAALNDSLDDLEDRLQPLLAQTLPESLLPLETIQQVKLNVALPYLVYDLIFIYLKTRGIDPKTHPVVAELDRVRQYFDKIKDAEDPEKRKTAVDKAAANRFIKHAISQAKQQRTPGEDPSSSTSGPSHIRFDADGQLPASQPRPPPAAAAAVPVKVTSKMLARSEYQKQLAAGNLHSDAEEDDADPLQVFDEHEEAEDGEEAGSIRISSEAKGKGKALDGPDVAMAEGKKRRRLAMDPFAGYGDEAGDKATKSPKKKKKKASSSGGGEPTEDTPASRSTKPKTKTRKKRDSDAAEKVN